MSFPKEQPSSYCPESCEQIQSHVETLTQELNLYKHTVQDLLARHIQGQKSLSLKKILVKSNGRLIIVHADDIDWIEAWGDYVRLHCKDKIHTIRQRVSDLEMRLDPEKFLRIGRSAIVNVDRIKELEPLNHGGFIICLYDRTQLNLSRYYRDRLIALFDIAL
jgi:two-component system LytT family response regulator